VLACAAAFAGATATVSSAQAQGVGGGDIFCDPGDLEVRSLSFTGNRAFKDDELAQRIVTTPSSWARRHLSVLGAKRCIDPRAEPSELQNDVYRLLQLYKYAGYYGTKVDTSVTSAGRDRVNVTFVITEGEPIRIDSLSITGLDSVPNRQEILANLWVQVGRPFDQTRIAADQDSILSRLRNSGYPRAEVLPSWTTRTDSLKVARVSLTVLPGPRSRIGQIHINVAPMEGRSVQIEERVVRKLLGIGAGELYREESLVAAQRSLYQTGAYRFVNVAPVPDSMQAHGENVVDLRVSLVEDYMRDINTEVGWATLDCFRTRAQVVNKNFLGGARRMELTGQLSKIGFGAPLKADWVRKGLCAGLQNDSLFSDTLNYGLNVTVRQPTLFGTWATPSLSFYTDRRSEFQAYLRTTYFGGEAALFKPIGSSTSLRLSYNLERGRTSADPALLCAVFSRCDPQSQQEVTKAQRLAIASFAVARVRTNSAVNPSSGYILRGESRNSAPFLLSDSSLKFAKGVGDLAWYHRLVGPGVLALRLRAGAIFGGTSSNGGPKLPPQQERLYAGGATSVRGYQQNELGALLYVANQARFVKLDDTTGYFERLEGNDDGIRVVPTGGNSLLVGNVDYRVPSPFLPELLQFTLFTDVGSVWNRDPLQRNLGFDPKVTPGLGVRVSSPIGTVQLNVGYNWYAQRMGPQLFAPPHDFTAGPGDQPAASVYCAVQSGLDPGSVVSQGGVPLAHLRVQENQLQWVPDNTPCPSTFSKSPSTGPFRRLTFTLSIGPDF
jgi:outer membrane protein assembly complex protein YaeT